VTEHVLVVHRWPDGRARYERFLEHLRVDVSYVCTAPAVPTVPETAAGVEVVRRTDDLAELADAAGRLSRRIGAPDRILALAAGDRQAAAELRVLLGCPGQHPPEVARHAPGPSGPRLDGLWDGSRLLAARLSRPVGGLTGPGLAGTGVTATVELDDADPAVAAPVLAAALDRPATVHLALRESGPGRYAVESLTPWLPDDELPVAWLRVHGVDLLAAEAALQLGEPLPPVPAGGFGEVAGWLAVRPPRLPCVVEQAGYRPVAEPADTVELPVPGTRLTGTPLSGFPPVRLGFRGGSTAAVERAVRQAAADLVLRCRPG